MKFFYGILCWIFFHQYALAQDTFYLVAKGKTTTTHPIHLQNIAVEVALVNNQANVQMTQTYISQSNEPLEIFFQFPTTSQIELVKAQLDNQSLSLLSNSPLNNQTFLGKILPKQVLKLSLEYKDVANFVNDVFQWNLPALTAPQFIQSVEKSDWVENPFNQQLISNFQIKLYLQTTMTIHQVACTTHPVRIQYLNAHSAILEASIEKQVLKDFVLQYKMENTTKNTNQILTSPQEEIIQNVSENPSKSDHSILNKEPKAQKHHLKRPETITLQVEHTIREGEYLYKLSKKYGVEIEDIRKWNKLKKDDLHLGQKIMLYAEFFSELHTVEPNETLAQIAQLYGVETEDLKKWNKLNSDNVQMGQKLWVYILANRFADK